MWRIRRRTPIVLRSLSMPCHDVCGRRGRIQVGITSDRRVSLTMPSGETLLLGLADMGTLRRLLRDAARAIDP